MRYLGLVLAGAVFCAIAAFLADKAAWAEAVAGSFVPYVAVPFASGFLARRSALPVAMLMGAASSVCLVAAFYGTNALASPYAINLWGPYFWSVAGLASGAVLGTASWCLAPRTFTRPWLWGGVYCVLLASAQAWVVLGPSIYSGADLVAVVSTVVFFCGLTLLAIQSGRISQAAPAPGSRRRV